MNRESRLETIKEMRKNNTLQEIGDALGVSKQRVSQILGDKYIVDCKKCGKPLKWQGKSFCDECRRCKKCKRMFSPNVLYSSPYFVCIHCRTRHTKYGMTSVTVSQGVYRRIYKATGELVNDYYFVNKRDKDGTKMYKFKTLSEAKAWRKQNIEPRKKNV